MELKSAWEIALEKHQRHEQMQKITEELFEHVAMLEECWDAIPPSERSPSEQPHPADRKAA